MYLVILHLSLSAFYSCTFSYRHCINFQESYCVFTETLSFLDSSKLSNMYFYSPWNISSAGDFSTAAFWLCVTKFTFQKCLDLTWARPRNLTFLWLYSFYLGLFGAEVTCSKVSQNFLNSRDTNGCPMPDSIISYIPTLENNPCKNLTQVARFHFIYTKF